MDDAEMAALVKLLDAAKNLGMPQLVEPNFFDLGGTGYLENPTSDLMALFMGSKPEHVPPWLGIALEDCLVGAEQVENGFTFAWDNVHVEREASVDGRIGGTKFLDILLTDGTNVIGIENKVFAPSNYNPFDDYNRLLERRAASGGKVLKCILQSYPRTSDPSKWPVLSYADLVDKALQRFGHDVLNSKQSKWQFYYQEFLHHLKHLAEQHMTKKMSPEGAQFIFDNFGMLQKVMVLLEQFDADMTDELSRTFATALSKQDSRDIDIRTGYGNWGERRKALRFFPDIWGGKSQMVVYYFANKGAGADGAMRFGVRAYISKENTRPLTDIERMFKDAIKTGTLPNTLTPKPRPFFYEERGRLLCLNAYPNIQTREGAIEAAKDMALWVDQHAFKPAQ